MNSATAITIERLFTSPAAFNEPSPTPCQRAICRIGDGLPLGELASCDDVRTMVGDVDALPVGMLPKEVHLYAAVRGGKSKLAAAWVYRATQSVDVSKAGVGDIVRISIVGLKLATNAIWTHFVQTVLAQPLLRRSIIGDPRDDLIVLRHPTGRPIEVMRIPLDRWGGSVISVYSAGVFVTEEPRQIGAEDGVKNWDDLHTASAARRLDGAQFVGEGATWAPFGPSYDLAQEFWGRPSADMIILRATGPMLNPSWWTPKRMADLLRTNPTAYRTDCLAKFADAESSEFTSDLIARSTRPSPVELPPDADCYYGAAMDPGTRGNAWTFTIATCLGLKDGVKKYAIVLCRQWVGSPGAPLSPESVLREIAAICHRYRVAMVRTDQWSGDALVDIARRVGLRLVIETITAARKLDLFENLKIRLEEDQLELPPVPLVREDLLHVRKRVTQVGVQITLTRTGDGRHADFASSIALVMASSLPPREGWQERRLRGINERRLALALGGASGNFFGFEMPET